MRYLILTAAVLCAFASPAHARHRRAAPQTPQQFNFFGNWFQQPAAAPPIRAARHRRSGVRRILVERSAPHEAVSSEGESILPHPDGCPSRAFCGCGAALRVFGHNVRSLWLAREWFRFPQVPHESAMPGMAAVRSHHVMVLEANLGRGYWRVYDANSGRHMTREHARSISGYRIVNPRG